MSALTVLWHDPESAGYTDILPTEWFEKTGVRRGCRHAVQGPRAGRYDAQCDVTVNSKYADLDYEPYTEFNEKQGMYLGVMRLQFATGNRDAVTQVLWKENGQHIFIPCSTTVGREHDSGGDGLEDLDLVEGRRYLVSHLAYERSAKLVATKKAAVLAATGKLACEACGFVFRDKYGALGDGYCEVHHRAQVAKSGVKKTKLNDLAILCSNCHRIIHRSGPPMLSVEAFAKTCLTLVGADAPKAASRLQAPAASSRLQT